MSGLTIESISEQEKSLLVSKFDDETAFAIGIAARNYALENFKGRSVIIDITTAAGACLFRTYIGEIQPDNETWIQKKRNTVVRFEKASKRYGLELEAKGRTLQTVGLNPNEYTNYGGGFPIKLASNPAFTFAVITVSGLKDHEDHAVCVAALKSVV
ncbi:hypothetical protein BON22_1209 [Cyberlindnera fabianii]|uniref:Uncharacterized protein n=1 Tax=Cyberlindnera fabianii TaxID=36022 RepID=A0A1V2L9P2_CYBFA|nr:hypothetical protein BON22_1209 [Cyberlindnera fabianii]